MMKRLEQLAALVVAAGLALVSYWLFFSWAQGGGVHRRQKPGVTPSTQQSRNHQDPGASEATPGLHQPLLGGVVVQAGDVIPHFIQGDSEPLISTDLNDPAERTAGIL